MLVVCTLKFLACNSFLYGCFKHKLRLLIPRPEMDRLVADRSRKGTMVFFSPYRPNSKLIKMTIISDDYTCHIVEVISGTLVPSEPRGP